MTSAGRRVLVVSGLVAALVGVPRAAGDYPLALSLEAKTATAATRVSSVIAIRIDRLMEESRRKRVTDALTYAGYGSFLNTLRTLPPVGSIALQRRSVEVRYAREAAAAAARRLVLVADRPLCFLADDRVKSRAGYELTVVELRIDPQGDVAGRILGAARVKPSPAGVVVDDYAGEPVDLAGRVGPR